MSRRIVVTGANGNVGGSVVDALAHRNIEVRAAIYGDRHEFDADIESRQLDFTDNSTWEHAFEGGDGLFVLRPPHISDVRKKYMPGDRCCY